MKNIELKGVKIIPIGFYRILEMKLEIFEINQIAIFKANRLMVQDLLH